MLLLYLQCCLLIISITFRNEAILELLVDKLVVVQCPWHGSRFDTRNGEVVRPPAMRPEPTYEVRVENNSILIKKQNEKS
ncbi:MAG: Rieske 2Fe-2S domain-containing protein [Thermoproteota archaeon]|nr:Rieske 2Fe-2S domain-containing protein [Thermoproteota archaeon]